jgi:hypothetical protein
MIIRDVLYELYQKGERKRLRGFIIPDRKPT